MSFQILSQDDILQQILRDHRNQFPGCDTSDTSEIYIRAVALASAIWGEYQNQYDIYNQIFPDLADSENLQRHALTTNHAPRREQGVRLRRSCRIAGRHGYPCRGGDGH